MRSYWGVEHGEPVSKLGSPKVKERNVNWANLATGSSVPSPMASGYQAAGKSAILRRPKYKALTAPDGTTEGTNQLAQQGALGLRVARAPRWSKQDRQSLHTAHQSKQPFSRQGRNYEEIV